MIWFAGYALEILLFNVPWLWRFKRVLSLLLILVVLATSAYVVLFSSPSFILIIFLLPFRLLNLLRVLQSRMHPRYLRDTTRRTSWVLLVLHALVLTIAVPLAVNFGYLLPWILLIVAAIMFGLALFHVHKTRHIPNTTHYSDKELPTVSICIPARNETDSLEQCLRSVIANDYPKLEILVLDDCSQDKTAEVIKSFAQDGVRFVQGEPPAERWLAKNQAYDKLLHEANGELILFCGVDVRFGPHVVRALVTTLLNRKKSMISVLPQRFYSKFDEAFVQPMRYWWELVPPRRIFNRPPVLSTCWLVNRKQMQKAGGFAAVRHAILPEGYFARYFIKTDAYSFIRADEELDVRTSKPFSEQWATAIRTNYPQIRRRPEMALLLTVFTFLFLIWPYVLVLFAFITLNIQLLIVAGLTCALLTSTHVLIMKISDPANVPLAFFTLPLAALTEATIGYVSMLKYEFGTVEWKDRNVCIPVMHVIPKLPAIPDKPGQA
jgi:chlorobactene glucosyltransferase